MKKKDGGLRFCADYCWLNRVTKLDVFPLPWLMTHWICWLVSNILFDLASGYWQVCMDLEKTAFITYSGLYKFKEMPFSLVINSPATFQRLMEVALTGLAREGGMVYLDDVLVIGRIFNNNLVNRLRQLVSQWSQRNVSLLRQKFAILDMLYQLKGSVLIQTNLKLCWNTRFPQMSKHYVHSLIWHPIVGSLLLSFLK